MCRLLLTGYSSPRFRSVLPNPHRPDLLTTSIRISRCILTKQKMQHSDGCVIKSRWCFGKWTDKYVLLCLVSTIKIRLHSLNTCWFICQHFFLTTFLHVEPDSSRESSTGDFPIDGPRVRTKCLTMAQHLTCGLHSISVQSVTTVYEMQSTYSATILVRSSVGPIWSVTCVKGKKFSMWEDIPTQRIPRAKKHAGLLVLLSDFNRNCNVDKFQ